jgi:hypothetical protein
LFEDGVKKRVPSHKNVKPTSFQPPPTRPEPVPTVEKLYTPSFQETYIPSKNLFLKNIFHLAQLLLIDKHT